MVRLQKILAQAGIASRRASETIIREGRAEVNGQRITRQGVQINPKADVVTVDAAIFNPFVIITWRYTSLVVFCVSKDERKRALLGDLLPADWDLKPVGRLDRDSEGLIFATNDGEFALRITHPRYELSRFIAWKWKER